MAAKATTSSGKKGRSFWWRRWKIEQGKCQGFHSSVLCMTNVWCPFISTITTCLTWCGWENILFWLVGTPQRQTRPNSNPSAGSCCPPLNQQRLFDQQPPACAGISYSWLQPGMIVSSLQSRSVGDQWLEVCAMGHIYISNLRFFSSSRAALNFISAWRIGPNCIWVLVDGEWMANIYFL